MTDFQTAEEAAAFKAVKPIYDPASSILAQYEKAYWGAAREFFTKPTEDQKGEPDLPVVDSALRITAVDFALRSVNTRSAQDAGKVTERAAEILSFLSGENPKGEDVADLRRRLDIAEGAVDARETRIQELKNKVRALELQAMKPVPDQPTDEQVVAALRAYYPDSGGDTIAWLKEAPGLTQAMRAAITAAQNATPTKEDHSENAGS